MAKKDSIVKVTPSNGVPKYLDKYVENDTSIEQMKEYRILPRLKVIQGTAAGDLKRLFDEGDIIIRPGDMIVAEVDKRGQKSETFLLVPIFFYPEFCLWSDLRDNDNPTILERSFDATSEIARRSKSQNRVEVYEGHESRPPKEQWCYRYVEHLVFVCYVYGNHPLSGELCVLSFQKGEFFTGKNFISAVSMRKAPMWAQVWQFNSAFRDRGQDAKWWGIDFAPPNLDDPYIKPEEIDTFQGAYNEFTELHKERKILVDRNEEKTEM